VPRCWSPRSQVLQPSCRASQGAGVIRRTLPGRAATSRRAAFPAGRKRSSSSGGPRRVRRVQHVVLEGDELAAAVRTCGLLPEKLRQSVCSRAGCARVLSRDPPCRTAPTAEWAARPMPPAARHRCDSTIGRSGRVCRQRLQRSGRCARAARCRRSGLSPRHRAGRGRRAPAGALFQHHPFERAC
jgi:hypothetical protein